MDTASQNREVVGTVGNLVEALFDEVSILPLSDGAKAALVTIMMGDVLKRNGNSVFFHLPPGLTQATVP
jgi:hypothetical protein